MLWTPQDRIGVLGAGMRVHARAMDSATFVPTDITGLNLWLDFSDLTTLFQDAARSIPCASNGDVIGGVADKSGAANHLGTTVTSRKPLYKTAIQNGRSVARFDGTDDALGKVTLTIASGSFTVYLAFIPAVKNWSQFIFDSETGRFLAYHERGGAQVGWYDDSFHDIAAESNVAQVLTFVFTSGGNGEVFRGSTSLGTAAYTAKAFGGLFGLFGRNNYESDSSNNLQGDACEFLIYTGAHDSTQRTNVWTYFSRWAL